MDWETRVGRSNNFPPFKEEGKVNSGKEIMVRQNRRDVVQQNILQAGTPRNNKQIVISKDGPKNNSYLVGPDDDELDGINLEERKIRRSEYVENIPNKEADFSAMDFSASPGSDLAKLAPQASQLK